MNYFPGEWPALQRDALRRRNNPDGTMRTDAAETKHNDDNNIIDSQIRTNNSHTNNNDDNHRNDRPDNDDINDRTVNNYGNDVHQHRSQSPFDVKSYKYATLRINGPYNKLHSYNKLAKVASKVRDVLAFKAKDCNQDYMDPELVAGTQPISAAIVNLHELLTKAKRIRRLKLLRAPSDYAAANKIQDDEIKDEKQDDHDAGTFSTKRKPSKMERYALDSVIMTEPLYLLIKLINEVMRYMQKLMQF